MSHRTRILLADDHRLIRQGLRRLFEAEPSMEIVGEAADGQMAVAMASELSPDVVLMDVDMPGVDGIQATGQIRAGKVNGDGPKVIALSAHSDPRFTSQMFKAGASGYVAKKSVFEELVLAVRSVIQNKVYLSPAVAGSIVAGLARDASPGANGIQLSGREREVVQLFAEGKSTKQVAMHLNLSIKTIETHRRNIMAKLDLDNLAELTKYAIREGITSLEQ